MKITDHREGNHPNPEQHPETQLRRGIGKYGLMREAFLKESLPDLYNDLVLNGTLGAHLMEVETAAQERLNILMPVLAKQAGATEELKAADQWKWIGLMNACKAQAEEMILNELIYDPPKLKKGRNNL